MVGKVGVPLGLYMRMQLLSPFALPRLALLFGTDLHSSTHPIAYWRNFSKRGGECFLLIFSQQSWDLKCIGQKITLKLI